MVECCRWIYARVLPDWSCPTKKLIEMIPIVSRLCLTVYFHKLENVIIDRLKNSTLHIGLRFGIQALEICEQHNAKRKSSEFFDFRLFAGDISVLLPFDPMFFRLK